MKNKWAWIVGGSALGVILLGGAALIGFRSRDARRFSQVYPVRTYNGTNYSVQLLTVTVGKAETGCVLIVDARLQNPNPFPLTLEREWFVLVDREKNYYQVSTTGPVQIPANGVIEKEQLSYVVPDEALGGMLALTVGHQYFALIKSDRPLAQPLQKGQFLMVRQLNW